MPPALIVSMPELVAALRRAQHGVGVADAAERAEREQALVLDAHARRARRRRCARSRWCTPRSSRASSRAWRSASRARGSAASSNVPLWKLRVGSAPKRLNVSRLVAVPSSRYFAVAGPNERFDRSRLSAVSSRGLRPLDAPLAAHGDRLDLLGAEHRAAAAAAGVAAVVRDRRVAHQALARRPDRRDAEAGARAAPAAPPRCRGRSRRDTPPPARAARPAASPSARRSHR